ncbi:FkbM family methyltransferase [bacterium 1XD21-13]|nr:FkbM family methyltransferase [bacterium 1XD21-13]
MYKLRYLKYGLFKLLVWRFLSKELRRKKGTAYKKYKENIEKIEQYISAGKLPDERDAREVYKFVRKKGLETVFPYDFIHKYFIKAVLAIKYDSESGMYYAKRKGRRLYLKHDSFEKALNYYWSLIYEQDKHSPHLYSEEKITGHVLFDIGGAEGFLSFDHIDDFEHIYIFEGDPSWFPALKKTFEDYSGKVTIIEKYVGDSNAENYLTIDQFCNNYNINDVEIFAKIDVEGEEMSVIKGAKLFLAQYNRLKMAICTYHKQEDEYEIRTELEQYNRFKISHSNGYMIMYYMNDIREPYLRRGVLRIKTQI